MVANAIPRFPEVGDIQWGATALATANTAKDGTGTVLTAFTADATDGSWVRSVRWAPAGTNIVTVGRVFINNGSTNATAGNNIYYAQLTLPATTNSEVAALATPETPLGFWLPPGYKINLTVGTTVAAGFFCSVVGGKY
jgi:hypothetical protein